MATGGIGPSDKFLPNSNDGICQECGLEEARMTYGCGHSMICDFCARNHSKCRSCCWARGFDETTIQPKTRNDPKSCKQEMSPANRSRVDWQSPAVYTQTSPLTYAQQNKTSSDPWQTGLSRRNRPASQPPLPTQHQSRSQSRPPYVQQQRAQSQGMACRKTLADGLRDGAHENITRGTWPRICMICLSNQSYFPIYVARCEHKVVCVKCVNASPSCQLCGRQRCIPHVQSARPAESYADDTHLQLDARNHWRRSDQELGLANYSKVDWHLPSVYNQKIQPSAQISTQKGQMSSPSSTYKGQLSSPVSNHKGQPSAPISTYKSQIGSPIYYQQSQTGSPMYAQKSKPGTAILTQKSPTSSPIYMQKSQTSPSVYTKESQTSPKILPYKDQIGFQSGQNRPASQIPFPTQHQSRSQWRPHNLRQQHLQSQGTESRKTLTEEFRNLMLKELNVGPWPKSCMVCLHNPVFCQTQLAQCEHTVVCVQCIRASPSCQICGQLRSVQFSHRTMPTEIKSDVEKDCCYNPQTSKSCPRCWSCLNYEPMLFSICGHIKVCNECTLYDCHDCVKKQWETTRAL